MSALAAPAAGSRLATNDSIDMFLVDMQGSARAHGFLGYIMRLDICALLAQTVGAVPLNTITTTWPLLLGMGVLMLGAGLQGTLLGLRATLEGFPRW